MILKVQIFRLEQDRDDVFEKEFFINFNNPASARRLEYCIRWAARNGRSVTVFAKEDE